MLNPQNSNSGGDREAQLMQLLSEGEQQLPGISELLHLYGDYTEMIGLVEHYLQINQPEPFYMTSNQSYTDREV